MKTYIVTVSQLLEQFANVPIEANSAAEALAIVNGMIAEGDFEEFDPDVSWMWESGDSAFTRIIGYPKEIKNGKS